VSFHHVARIAIVATVLWLGATTAHATKIQRVVSPGGLVAWLVQDATVPLIAMEYAFTGGATQDPAGKAGVANFTAGVLDEGAGDLDTRAFRERLDRSAISLSFDAARDHFRGSLRTLKDKRDEAFDLTRLALTQPRFDTEPTERVRAQVMSNAAPPERQSEQSIASRKLLRGKPMASTPMPCRSAARWTAFPTITVDDLKDLCEARDLARDTLTIAVVGDIDAATLGPLLDRTFGGLPAKADLVTTPDVEMSTSANRINVRSWMCRRR
jgi:zinc protease